MDFIVRDVYLVTAVKQNLFPVGKLKCKNEYLQNNCLFPLCIMTSLIGMHVIVLLVQSLVWCFLWIGWNTFVICFYLDVGILQKASFCMTVQCSSILFMAQIGMMFDCGQKSSIYYHVYIFLVFSGFIYNVVDGYDV